LNGRDFGSCNARELVGLGGIDLSGDSLTWGEGLEGRCVETGAFVVDIDTSELEILALCSLLVAGGV